MYSIKKRFGPYPFAHRQHSHDGHCQYVHGHNWYFEVEMKSYKLDSTGFVFDFGKFKPFKNWLEYMFDHTLLINQNDPYIDLFIKESSLLWDMREVKSGSSEEIAVLVYNYLSAWLEDDAEKLVSVTVIEDEKNGATYYGRTIPS